MIFSKKRKRKEKYVDKFKSMNEDDRHVGARSE